MARNQSNIQGIVTQPQNTDTSAGNNRSRWYKPTWYTLTTEAVVGVTGGTIIKMLQDTPNTEEALIYGGITIATALVAGEAARAVTTGFELGPVAGAGAGVLTGAVTGGLTGATILTTVVSILSGNFNDLFNEIIFGGGFGAILGGIAGLATGLESARWSKPDKSSKAGSNKTGSAVGMARNQSNIQGLVPQPQNTDTSAGNNRPRWYTLGTETIVGTVCGEIIRRG
jgi:hypothetical protein